MSRVPTSLLLLALAGAAPAAGKLDFLPLPSFGAQVVGLHVSDLVRRSMGLEEERAEAEEEVRQLRAALHRERLLVFRGLGRLPWEDQKAFSALFGEVFNESAHSNRAPHPAVPDPRVALFSNNPSLGAVSAGTEGWHVDGNVVPVPHAITLIHAISAIPEGDTFFVPLREVVQTLRKQGLLRGTCVERAPPCLVVGDGGQAPVPAAPQKDLPALDDVVFQSGHVKDLIYPHPVTGLDTMMFGLGKLSGIYRHGCLQPALPASLELNAAGTGQVAEAIQTAIEDTQRVLRWRWADGDLLMVDNLAVAHHASEGTQAGWEQVGVRLMQRTTVTGGNVPTKRPVLHVLPHECAEEEGPSGTTDHYCVFSLASLVNYEVGRFDSREVARERCRQALAPGADLAVPATRRRNEAMGRVVASVGLPHWIGGDDSPNGYVTWLDGTSAEKGWGANSSYPWHGPSGQPNDCDGPGSETCMFMGPGAKWFDFACQPKVPNKTNGVTPGPEIRWDRGEKRMYDIQVLCGLSFPGGEAARLGLRMSM